MSEPSTWGDMLALAIVGTLLVTLAWYCDRVSKKKGDRR